jgi:hypothetical protein
LLTLGFDFAVGSGAAKLVKWFEAGIYQLIKCASKGGHTSSWLNIGTATSIGSGGSGEKSKPFFQENLTLEETGRRRADATEWGQAVAENLTRRDLE